MGIAQDSINFARAGKNGYKKGRGVDAKYLSNSLVVPTPLFIATKKFFLSQEGALCGYFIAVS